MAFGQSPGYPATRNQMEELTGLVLEAGHVDFRDARGPLGLTQRQAGGKFTRDEADALIALLQTELEGSDDAGGGEHDDAAAIEDEEGPTDASVATGREPLPPRSRGRSSSALSRIPSETLAAELQSRGWVVMEP